MKEIKTKIQVRASKEKVWDLLFNRFGEVSVFNPLIDGSHHSDGAEGAVGCERVCDIDSNTRVRERITGVRGTESFDIEIIEGGLPLMDRVNATLDLKTLGEGITEVEMTVRVSTKPALMIHFMAGMIRRMFFRLLIGLKYHLETGRIVNKSDMSRILKWYRRTERRSAVLEAA